LNISALTKKNVILWQPGLLLESQLLLEPQWVAFSSAWRKEQASGTKARLGEL
jgi:hypothetical protein